MSPANQYKKFENKIISNLIRLFRTLHARISAFTKKMIDAGKQKFTIMFIPHSEKKIINFRVSVFFITFFASLAGLILLIFFYITTHFSGMNKLLTVRSEDLKNTKASLEVIRDEISELRRNSKSFEKSMKSTLDVIGLGASIDASISNQNGDLSSFFGVEEESEGIIKELSELKRINSFIKDSSQSLDKVANLLISQGDLLRELPTQWPVKGGVGIITSFFGPAEHPITHRWYLHKGVDIAYRAGVPVIATAGGKVIEKRFDVGGYGYYVTIRHKYGFYTKYTHLQWISVQEGDNVNQGDRLGTMGSSGLSTGPHLHYEVRIGSQVVDPLRFLNINNKVIVK